MSAAETVSGENWTSSLWSEGVYGRAVVEDNSGALVVRIVSGRYEEASVTDSAYAWVRNLHWATSRVGLSAD